MTRWAATITLDGTDERLVRLVHTERVDDVARTQATLIVRGDPPTLADLIGKGAVVTVNDVDLGTSREIAGIVVEASLSDFDAVAETPTQRLELDIAPRLALLEHRSDCRAFQKQAADAIAVEVLKGAGYTSGDVEIAISEPLPERAWVVQLNETDLCFLLRLLSEEGVSLAVETRDGHDMVVLFDTDRGATDPAELPFRPQGGMETTEAFISDITCAARPRPGKVTMRDYDFEKPREGLEVVSEADADNDFEVFDYPGRYADEEEGKRRAKLRLEALRTSRNVISATASCLGLGLGQRVRVKNHPYEPLNGDLWLQKLVLYYDEVDRDVRMELEGVPAAAGPVRPALRPAAATAPGLSTAFITGTSGQEIDPDEHGRTTVWFPWDRLGKKDESSSLKVRALQLPWGGSQLTPRIGWEVSVAAFEADLDAPLILHRMMNPAAPPPYSLPAEKTKFAIQTATTPGGGSVNEIRIDDAAGNEELFMNASKDASVGVGNNATDTVTVDEIRTVSGNQSIEVGGGWTGAFDASQLITVGGNQTLTAATKGADESGSHSLTIAGNRKLTVGGDYKKTASGASSLNIGGNEIQLVIGSYDTNAKATFSETTGAADVLLASKKSLHVVGARSETAGAAKVILAAGDRVASAASMSHTVAGAIGSIVRGDRAEEASGDWTEVAGGAHVIQGNNIVFEADSLLSIVMGGSTLTLTPAAIAIAGATVTINATAKEGIAVVDL